MKCMFVFFTSKQGMKIESGSGAQCSLQAWPCWWSAGGQEGGARSLLTLVLWGAVGSGLGALGQQVSLAWEGLVRWAGPVFSASMICFPTPVGPASFPPSPSILCSLQCLPCLTLSLTHCPGASH